ncbi:MAG: DMT family transporter [Firmicutes bacterium]|nr:DMT family transporter [Bacillota bacterium]
MIQILCAFLSFSTGAIFTVQSAINGRLRTVTANPVFASLASFGTGVLTLLLLIPLFHLLGIYQIPAASQLLNLKLWMLIGGVIGTALVVGSIIIPKRIGFASYFSMLVTGQLVGSVICDATGLFGAEVHAPGPARILGVVLLLTGAILVQKRD